MSKNIVCGEIDKDDEWIGTPIELFKRAVSLSKKDSFCIKTNNPQLIETIEVLCGENNINFYIYMDGKYYKEDDVANIYNYLGDIYSILNVLRMELESNKNISDEVISEEITEYELKYQFIYEEKNSVDEEKLNRILKFYQNLDVSKRTKQINLLFTKIGIIIKQLLNQVIG